MTVDLTTRDRTTVPAPRTASERELPWREPSSPRGRRPRTEYWDVATARWTVRPPVPGPRRGD